MSILVKGYTLLNIYNILILESGYSGLNITYLYWRVDIMGST